MSDEPTLPQEFTEIDAKRGFRDLVGNWNDLQNHIIDDYRRALYALEAAWKERDNRDILISNLQQQNTELLEDIAALRMEMKEAQATVRVLNRVAAEVVAERNEMVAELKSQLVAAKYMGHNASPLL